MNRLLLVVALIVGVSFYVVPRTPDAAWWIAWKTIGVALLAWWAGWHARDKDGWLLVGVLAFGALGDMLLETSGMTIGGAAFLVGHVLAIMLYLGNPRVRRTQSIAGAAAGAVIVAGTAFALTRQIGVACYAAGLGGMAGCAVASRFPIAGVGAVLFAFSDLMIFAALGPLGGSPLPGMVIWPAYFAGQALVAIGVVHGLRRRPAAPISVA